MKIIQISDLHICKNTNQNVFSQNSMDSLKKIADDIKKHEDITFILITGDISQDGSIDSYNNALKLLREIEKPIYCIPGNHDNIVHMYESFSDSKLNILTNEIKFNNWEFYYLNTLIAGKDSGIIVPQTLSTIKEKLEKTSNNVVIVTHHHLLPVGTPLVDECMVLNSEKILKILDENQQVKLVMCGHVHGDYHITRNHYCQETSPATCFQWEKTTKTPQSINLNGYKIFNFQSNTYESECIFL